MNLEYLKKLRKQNILILGFARSGYQTAKILNDYKVKFILASKENLENNELAKELMNKGIKIVTGEHKLSLLDNLDLIIKNPGIPYDIEFLKEAQKRNIMIITEVELAYLLYNQKVIAITGTNGKTTTTMLTYNILKKVYPNTKLAGNIGYPVIEVMENNKENGIIVMEISSFQLNGTYLFKPYISVITNLGEAHLDYHKNKENYHNIKKKIFKNQTKEDYIILNEFDEKKCEKNLIKANLIKYSTEDNVKLSAYIKDGYFIYKNEKIFELKKLLLKGKHNLENCINATIIALINNVPKEKIQDVLYSFSGVIHRLQYLGNIDGVNYYNDSKSTNPESTIKALSSFEKNIILICGGKDRGINFKNLSKYLKNTKTMICIGESKHILESLALENKIKCYLAQKVSDATKLASRIACAGDTILLSPACASWDQYKDFEERGDEFIKSYNLIKKNKNYEK